MATERISQLLFLLDDAFGGPDWHSLLTNLGSVTSDDWEWVPPNGQRTIRRLVRHVGANKYLYHKLAFGGTNMTWDEIVQHGDAAMATIPSAIEWVREGHNHLRQSVAALEDDSELLRLRGHHSGTPRETRWLLMIMMQHDLYHAGEINHIRALHQQND
jgi:uncharacterized damage-inducible protein DinB